MLSGRDRALALFLGVQLVVAIAFGAVLVHALRKPSKPTVVVTSGAATGTAATQGTTTTSTTSGGGAGKTEVVGGSAGSAGSGAVAGSGGLSDKGTGAGAQGVKAGAAITFGSIIMQNFAISFTDSKYGTQTYLQQVNAAGGAGGHKIQMIYDDDEGSSSTGDSEVNSLIAQNVFAFAAFNAPETEGDGTLVKKLAQYQIPLIGSYGESSEYMSPYAFAFSAYYSHYGYEMGLFLAKKGIKKPGIIYVDNSPDTTANASIESGFKDGLKAGGLPGTYTAVVVNPINPNYGTYVNTLSSAGVDGLASIVDAAGFQKLFAAETSSNYTPTNLVQALFDESEVKDDKTVAAFDAAHPVYVASDLSFPEQKTPAVEAFVNAMEAAGHEPTYFAEQGWLDAEYLTQAVSKLGSTFTRTQLLAAVNSLGSYDNGLTAPLHISPGSHDMNRCIQFGVIQNSVLTPVQGFTCDNEPV